MSRATVVSRGYGSFGSIGHIVRQGFSGEAAAVVPARVWTIAGGAPFTLELVSGPAIEPITLGEMKKHLRCYTSNTADDDKITRLIVAARRWVEDYTSRALIDQTWRITLNGRNGPFGRWGPYVGDSVRDPGWFGLAGWNHWFNHGEILLRKSPILEITDFVTADSAGEESEISTGDYALCEPDSKWPRIAAINGATIWNVGALRVEFRAGYADRSGVEPEGAEVVPEQFIAAMELWTQAHYDRDEKMMPILIRAAENMVKSERTNLQLA